MASLNEAKTPANLTDQNSEHYSMESDLDISCLPDEILKRVIQFVPKSQWPKLELVNRAVQCATHLAWSNLRAINCDDDFLMNREALRTDKAHVLNLFLRKLLLRSPRIISLDGFWAFNVCGGYGLVFDDSIIELLAEFKYLLSVRFEGVSLACSQLVRFLQTTKSRGKLRELDVDPPPTFKAAENDDFWVAELHSAFDDRADLERLRLEKFSFGRSNIRYPEYGAPFIGNINVMQQLTDLRLFDLQGGQKVLIALINRCTSLHYLEIGIEAFFPSAGYAVQIQYYIDLFHAIALSPSDSLSVLKFHRLQHGMDIETENEFNAALVQFIRRLAGRLNPLSELSLSYFSLSKTFRDDGGFEAIADYHQRLTALDLDISRCSTEVFQELLIKLRRLEKLKLRSLNSQQHLAIISTSMVRMMNLKYLDLSSDSSWKRPGETSDLLTHFAKLKGLRLSGKNFIQCILRDWDKEGNFSHLESLELNCGHLDDELTVPLLENLPKLQRLCIYVADITDSSLKVLAKSCPDLRELELSHCKAVTPNGLQAVIGGCTNLKKTTLSNMSSNFDEKWYGSLGMNKFKIRMKGKRWN